MRRRGFLLAGRDNEDVVNLDVRMDHALLVHVPDALQHILRPDGQLVASHRAVPAQDLSPQVVRAIACVLHVDAVQLVRLRVVEGLYYVRMV